MVLVTGCAGFIGFHTCAKLLKEGHQVIGIDNLNEYYDVSLKEARLSLLKKYPNFSFYKLDIADRSIFDLAQKHSDIEYIIHCSHR